MFYKVSHIIFIKGTFPPIAVIAFLLLFGLTLFMLIWIELRKVMTRVTIDDNYIKVRYWGGLGKGCYFEYKLLDGFKTSTLPSRYDDYEYMYIIKNGKTVMVLSEFYHKNYKELYGALKDKIPYITHERFKLMRYLKHMLS